MDPRLLIAAIYAPSPNNEVWYRLQERFIAATTRTDFVFEVFLNGVDARALAGARVMATAETNQGHPWALARVLDHFRHRPHPAYLILDSDCFPVAARWHEVLDAQMERYGKLAAAPFRTENLDLFPHPSAVYLRPGALSAGWLDFDQPGVSKNILGQEIRDVGTAMTGNLAPWLPLLRTNLRNVHPVGAAIYHHLFYHHGAGSREMAFRVLRRYGYYEHWYDNSNVEAQQRDLLAALLADPEGFVGSLMGADEPLVREYLRPPR